jgi:diphthamide biosynthesis protein 3
MSFYDEIEIEDMTWDTTLDIYHYPCPCGDRFEISLGDMLEGEDVAVCPSCSLMIKVIFEIVSLSYSALVLLINNDTGEPSSRPTPRREAKAINIRLKSLLMYPHTII